MRSIRNLLKVNVRGKVVVIELCCHGDVSRLANLLVCDCLDVLIDMDVIKYYKNRIDYFVVMPQNGCQPIEVLVEIKKWLKI